MKKKISIIFLVVLFDQIVKLIISSNMKLLSSIEIIPNFFSITYVQNRGAAFSILNNNVLLLIILSLVGLYFIYKYILKNLKHDIISSLIIGGIIGNLIDRVFRGYVIDYLHFRFLNIDFAIFNIADIFIVIGCLILIYITIKEK